MAKKSKYVWAIAYINKDLITRIEYDLLKKEEFSNLKFYVPTVRVLNKRVKKHAVYNNEPLCFNYGFFRIAKNDLINYPYLERLKECVPAISGWVKDRANAHSKALKKEIDESIPIATAPYSFIVHLAELQKVNDIYSPTELTKVTTGDLITLKYYPFEGLSAEVLKIDYDLRKIRIKLIDQVSTGFYNGEMEVEFENVFWTIYKSQTEENLMGHQSLDEIGSINRNHKVFRDE